MESKGIRGFIRKRDQHLRLGPGNGLAERERNAAGRHESGLGWIAS